VWSVVVVMTAPLLDDHRRLRARPKPFQAQALIAQLAVERFVGAILPWLAGIVSAVSMSAVCSHRRIARDTNSGP